MGLGHANSAREVRMYCWYSAGDPAFHPRSRRYWRSFAGSCGPMLAASSKGRWASSGRSAHLRYALRFEALNVRPCHGSSSHVHCLIELNGAWRPGSGTAGHIGRKTNGSNVRHSRPRVGISESGSLILAPIVRKTPWSRTFRSAVLAVKWKVSGVEVEQRAALEQREEGLSERATEVQQ